MYLPIRVPLALWIAASGLTGFLKASSITVTQASLEVAAEGGTPISTPGTVTGMACSAGPNGGCESSFASLAYSDGDANGSVQGTTSGGTGTAGASASVTATYYFEIFGPSGVTVPLLITASGSTSASGALVLANSRVSYAAGEFLACSGTGGAAESCLNGLDQPYPTSYSGTESFTLASDVLSDVQVLISGDSGSGSGSFSANVDPTVEIDPTFADASEFTLVFSADVSAPEPGTSVLLLGAGLVCLARLLRRRDRFGGRICGWFPPNSESPQACLAPERRQKCIYPSVFRWRSGLPLAD